MEQHRAVATVNVSCAFLVAIALGVTGNGAGAQAPVPTTPTPTPPAPVTPAPPASQQATPAVEVFRAHEVKGVLGEEVVSATNENMGRIVDALVDHTGKVRAAVIDFGGFLGVGSRKIAVDWSALHFPSPSKPGTRITLEFTRDQVKAAPEYQDGKPVALLGVQGISVSSSAGYAKNNQSLSPPAASRPEYETYWPTAEQEAAIPYRACELAIGWKDRRLICWGTESRGRSGR